MLTWTKQAVQTWTMLLSISDEGDNDVPDR